MNDELIIGLIQSNLHWENIEANLAMFEEKIWQWEKFPDVIALPEMFSTGFTMNAQKFAEPSNSKTFRWMKQMAAQTGSVVCGSYIIVENQKYYNRFFAVYPGGEYKHYDKKHLFSLAGEDESFSAGAERMIFEVKGWRIFPMICYDLRFPVWSRSVNYNYDVLLYVANWPKPRINAWNTLLQARAIENLSYCVGVNRIGTDGYEADYNGYSGIYNHKGEPLFDTLVDIESAPIAILDKASMQKFRSRYNFMKEADSFKLL